MDLRKTSKEFFLFAFPLAMVFFFIIVIERKEYYDVYPNNPYTPTVYGYPFAYYGMTPYRLRSFFLLSFIFDFIFYLAATCLLWFLFRQIFKKEIKIGFSYFLICIALSVSFISILICFLFYNFKWDFMTTEIVEGYWKITIGMFK